MAEIKIIGLDNDEAARFLESGLDVCFGRHFSKSAVECINCRAPLVKDNKVLLMKEWCCQVHAGSNETINRLSSQDVQKLLDQGATLKAIFREILARAPVEHYGAEARQLLIDRLHYLQSLNPVGLPEAVPRLKELLTDE